MRPSNFAQEGTLIQVPPVFNLPGATFTIANDYATALKWLSSSLINFYSFALDEEATVISLGSNPTERWQRDFLANGLSNLNSCKMYLAKIHNEINLTEGDN